MATLGRMPLCRAQGLFMHHQSVKVSKCACPQDVPTAKLSSSCAFHFFSPWRSNRWGLFFFTVNWMKSSWNGCKDIKTKRANRMRKTQTVHITRLCMSTSYPFVLIWSCTNCIGLGSCVFVCFLAHFFHTHSWVAWSMGACEHWGMKEKEGERRGVGVSALFFFFFSAPELFFFVFYSAWPWLF